MKMLPLDFLCLLYDKTYLYSYTVMEKLKHCQSKISQKITRLEKSIWVVMSNLYELSKMESMKSAAFVVQKTLDHLFFMQKF